MSALKQAACHSRSYRAVYPKTSKARPQTPNVKQQYVLPTSTFEFGPLLVGRPPPPPQSPRASAGGFAPAAGAIAGGMPGPPAAAAAAPPDGHPDHTSRFKIANCGMFSLHADFWLKSEGETADPAAAPESGRGSAKKGPGPAVNPRASMKGTPPPAPAVSLWPRSMELGISEARELRVTVYPQFEGHGDDFIMCRLAMGSGGSAVGLGALTLLTTKKFNIQPE